MKGPAEVVHGPILIGFVFNVLLYGMMVTQSYIYYSTYKGDKRWMKIFVLLLLVADSANTVFDFIYLYRSLIIHFGDTNFLTSADWYFATDPAMTGIIACAVQLFFAWRVGTLTRSWPLVVAVCLGAISGCAGAIATSFEVVRTPQFAEFRNFKPVVIVWLALAAVTDLIITTILVWFLHKHKSGFKQSDLMIDRIIRLTVQTGLITALIATLDLIFYLGSPTGLHLIFNFPLCKLYSNSLMSSLNARRGWRFGSSNPESSMVQSTGNQGILLTSTVPTSPLSPNSPKSSFPLQSFGDSYDNFSNDNGPFTSHGKNAHSGQNSKIIPHTALHSRKSVSPSVLVHVESHELRDHIGDKRQELPCSPNQRAMNIALSIDTEANRRETSWDKDEENENVYKEKVQSNNGAKESRDSSSAN